MDFLHKVKRRDSKFRLHDPGRIDFTPMVDLGFLLISFFIFTTRLNEPVAMKLYMPKEEGSPTFVKCHASITLYPMAAGKIGWSECEEDAPPQIHISNRHEIRSIILQKLARVQMQFNDAGEMVVIIKPAPDCAYGSLIDVLDEMTINGVTRYAIVDLDEADRKLLSVLR